MNDPESGTDTSELSRSEVRGRALTGVLYVTASGGLNLLIGFIGGLGYVRMLTPEDFGVVAVGLTATLLGTAISDGGFGAGMIRRPEPPTRTRSFGRSMGSNLRSPRQSSAPFVSSRWGLAVPG